MRCGRWCCRGWRSRRFAISLRTWPGWRRRNSNSGPNLVWGKWRSRIARWTTASALLRRSTLPGRRPPSFRSVPRRKTIWISMRCCGMGSAAKGSQRLQGCSGPVQRNTKAADNCCGDCGPGEATCVGEAITVMTSLPHTPELLAVAGACRLVQVSRGHSRRSGAFPGACDDLWDSGRHMCAGRDCRTGGVS